MFLFSQYKSCDNTLGNCFFQISSYSRACVRIIREGSSSPGTPIQPKEVYCAIQWIVIYPPDSAIHLSNNWGLMHKNIN